MKKFHVLKGFTLVELIIVITILAILATIAFVSFQSYTKDARDSNRLASLKSIETGLQTFQLSTGNYPEPDSKVNITASGTIIGYQGYVGDILSKLTKLHQTPLDPEDNSRYIYSTNNTNTKYELLANLEKRFSLSYISKSYAGDYSQKTPYMIGNSIGIVLNSDNSPINNNIDVVTTGNQYKMILGNSSSGVVIGTGGILGKFHHLYSCLRLKESGSNTDGIYKIYPEGGNGFDVYCDMNTDGGGWTLIFNEKNIGSFWNGTNMTVSFSGRTDCTGYNEYCVNKSYSTIPVTSGIMLDGGKNISGGNFDSRTIFNGVNNVVGKNIYYLFNNTGAQTGPSQTFWNLDGVKIIKGFENSSGLGPGGYNGTDLLWDYGHIVYQYKRLVLNDDETITDGLISGHWSNSCKWPTNPCYPNHWYPTYRMWVR